MAGTIGYTHNHAGGPIFEASVSGEAREVGGLEAGRATTTRLIASSLIAEHLHDQQGFPATSAELVRAVTVTVVFPRFTIRARGDSAGYAALLAQSWTSAVTPALGALLLERPEAVAEKLAIARSGRKAARTALLRERRLARQPAAAALDQSDPLVTELARLRASVFKPVDLVAVDTAHRVPTRVLNRSSIVHILTWLIAGAGSGLMLSLLSGAVSGARGRVERGVRR